MLDRTKYPDTPDYILKGAREILQRMNYDLSKEIYPQFVERMGEENLKGKKRRRKNSSSNKK